MEYVFVLIMMLNNSNGASIATQEFTSEKACMAAAKKMYEYEHGLFVICTKK